MPQSRLAPHIRRALWRTLLICSSMLLLWACANVGNPEGGPYDMAPPRLIGTEPLNRSLGVDTRHIRLSFDEYVKIAHQDRIAVSPLQLTQPVFQQRGRSIVVRLQDSLLPNTTYSIYFDDAVVDNNEDNPIEDLAYYFSTGNTLDTMQIGGMVLDAMTLEPVGDLVVGAYFASDVSDSTIYQEAMRYGARTNKMGVFRIRALRDSTYRLYALRDDDNDLRYNGLSEGMAWSDSLWRTSKVDSIRIDTIRIDSIVRRDTIRRDSLVSRDQTYYRPDKVVLRYWLPRVQRHGLDKYTRLDSAILQVALLSIPDSLPKAKLIDYPSRPLEELVYTERDGTNINYWLRDTTIASLDSVRLSLEYLRTDSTGAIAWQTDTLTMHKPRQHTTSVRKGEESTSPLKIKLSGSSGILSGTLRDSIILESNMPLENLAPSAITLEQTQDSVYTPTAYTLKPLEGRGLKWLLDFERRYGTRYQCRIDSAALRSIYGDVSDSVSYHQNIVEEAELGALELFVQDMPSSPVVVQLLDKGEQVLLSSLALPVDSVPSVEPTDSVLMAHLGSNGSDSTATTTTERRGSTGSSYRAYLTDLKPGEYYVRLFVDDNGDGKWTTGTYPSRQPEMMYYIPRSFEVKKGFTTTERVTPGSTPLYEQKPEALRKAKPEERRKREDKNVEYYRKHPPRKPRGT